MPVQPISHKGKLELCQSGGHEGEFELGQSALNVRTPSALPATTRALPILNDRTAGRLNHGAASRGFTEGTR